MKKRNFTPLGILIGVLIVAGVSYRLGAQSVVVIQENGLDFTMANSVWEVIGDRYLGADEIDQENIKYGLAKGIVNALDDQHSAFLSPEEAQAFLTSLNGELEGIGAELRLKDGVVVVVSPLPDSPAERAGIRSGDIILKVDGVYLGNVSNLFEVVLKIRGKKGTEVVLTVLHEGEIVPEDISIIRDEIQLKAVEWEEKESSGEKIAVLQLSSFTESVGAEFGNTLQEIVDGGYSKMVLDLRFNGGGYLEGAVDILSYFLDPKQPIVYIRDQNSTVPRRSEQQKVRYRGDLVILVNDSSASAAEIVAGALQELDLAHLIGVQTFGKGTVQEVHPFFDRSMIRITIAEWLTAQKRSIEGIGIEPDQIVELDYDAFIESGEDKQLEAALNYLTSS